MAVTRAEGLGANGNQLKIGYDATGGSDSSTLADLSTDGAVSGAISSGVVLDGISICHANPFALYA